MDFDTKR
jgi:hypothetical protein